MSLTRIIPTFLRKSSQILVTKTNSTRQLSSLVPRSVLQYKHSSLLQKRLPKHSCFCAAHSRTTGEEDLEHFLSEEIQYELEGIQEIPQFNNFKLSMDGTEVKLKKTFNGENVVVSFNVNENINVDESPENSEVSEDEVPESDIVSYPSFSVAITKPSGKTLEYSCSINTGVNEDPDTDDEDQSFDLFRFDNVSVYNAEDGKKNIYEAETQNMDVNLYSMLMTILMERGVNGSFVNNLLDLSTTVEHRHYVNFLKDLKSFISNI